MLWLGLAVLATISILAACSQQPREVSAITITQQIEQGKYLVTVGGCNDCHSPKIITAKGTAIDPTRLLSGHPAEVQLPEIPRDILAPNGWGALTTPDMTAWAGPWGISFASNLTPDEVTGVGAWIESSFIAAMRNGRHLGTGRPILPPMPWENLNQLSDEDLKAIFTYLKSLKPINNRVPMPVIPERMSFQTQ
jgi:mono/diheme cytochrome c family protein